jgi:hypothetical protein
MLRERSLVHALSPSAVVVEVGIFSLVSFFFILGALMRR